MKGEMIAKNTHAAPEPEDAHDFQNTPGAKWSGPGGAPVAGARSRSEGWERARRWVRRLGGRNRVLALGVLLTVIISIPVAQAIRKVGTPGDDVIEGTNGDDVLFGEAGNDRLYGFGGNDRLEGGADDDQLYGGAGADVLNGGPGNDVLSYFDSNAGVTVNLATGAASGGHATGDTFSGFERVSGSQYNDRLTGNDGNNELHGGAGADVLDGGPGYDFASYSGSNAAVTVNLATGAASGGHATGDTFSGIERLGGSRYNDHLTGDDGDNFLVGRAGADMLDGGAGRDVLGYFPSTAGVTVNLATGAASGGHAEGDTFVGFESLEGSRYNDRLTGNDGNNELHGGAGADVLDGGPGNDFATYSGSDAAVTVNLATGAASGGHATGDTFSGIERLGGSRYNDHLTGDDGDNFLVGRAGADMLDGGAGRDVLGYFPSTAGVTVNLATGAASGGHAEGDTFVGFESLEGSRYNDHLTGDDGDNRIFGLAGNDRLEGGDGNDSLWGGAGADRIDGGEGVLDYMSFFSSNAAVTVNLATGAASGGYASGDTFSGIEWLGGSRHDDHLTGDDGDNLLHGAAGADVLDGGEGVDFLSYAGSDAAVTVNLATGAIFGGHADGDTYSGIEGVVGSRYDDRLTGDDGDNRFHGGAGADVLAGGEGVDYMSYSGSDAGVTISLATRTASGGDAEGDIFTGIEDVRGSDHDDRLTGDDGDNELEGLGGNDHLVGGAGDDTFIFESEHGDDVIADFTDGMDRIDLTEFDLPNGFDDLEVVAYAQLHSAALFPAASDALGRQGFARIINHSDMEGRVHIDAYDNSGVPYGPLTLTIGAGETVHFNSDDLEQGNPEKGLEGATGAGEGPWRLEFASALDIRVLSYARTEDGFLTSMHDLVPPSSSEHRVVTFNPGRNVNQMSRLRLINPGDEPTEVRIEGIDDRGDAPGSEVTFSLMAGESRTLDANELETGEAEGLSGGLGTGSGKWRLRVTSEQPLQVMSLLSSPTGHLTNLSTVPDNSEPDAGSDTTLHRVPLFPSAASQAREGVQGFARIINHSEEAGEVTIEAFNDEGEEHGPVILDIDAGRTVHLNSQDLESGNPDKGLADGIGAGTGNWRLRLSSSLALEVLSYIRTEDGFLTSMHDQAPETADGHSVVIFNPGRNRNQVSQLRLINPGAEEADVRIEGIDDKGQSPGSAVLVSVASGAARTLTSQELESGNAEGVTGALGAGSGKWRLTATSDQAIEMMSLLSSPTGHLTNLSTAGTGDLAAVPTGGVIVDLSAHGGGTILLRNFDIADLDETDFVLHAIEEQSANKLPAASTLELEIQGVPVFQRSSTAIGESMF